MQVSPPTVMLTESERWTATGAFIDSHKIFSILLKHLAEDLGLRGEVVKTFSTTEMVTKLAREIRSSPARHTHRIQIHLRADAHPRRADRRRRKRGNRHQGHFRSAMEC